MIAQVLANGYGMKTTPVMRADAGSSLAPQAKTAPAPQRTGAMSFPMLGLIVLLFSGIMLLTFDSFLGVGAFSLFVFGKYFDWDSAFGPLHAKLGISSDSSASEGGYRNRENADKDTAQSEPLLGVKGEKHLTERV